MRRTDGEPESALVLARRLWADERGGTTLEWCLVLAAVVIPSWYVIQLAITSLVGHYQMMTFLNSLPFP